jgi:AmpE protein
MKLLALLIAFVVSHMVSKPERFRRFDWLYQFKNWVIKSKIFESPDLNMLLLLIIPILTLQIIIQIFFSSSLGLFIVSILVLAYCIGPEDLEEQFNNGKPLNDTQVTKYASKDITSEMTRLSMYRWFGVLFWYIVLGIVGVLLYRFAERLLAKDEKSELNQSLMKLMRILNYPVAWMMVLALAIASDFERVYKKCKPFMKLDTMKNLDTQFLIVSMEFAVNNCEIDESFQEGVEQVTLKVLKRMLIVCIVFISLLVILAI